MGSGPVTGRRRGRPGDSGAGRTTTDDAQLSTAARPSHGPVLVRGLTFDDVRDRLVEWTGSDAFDVLVDGYRELLTRIFRHDSPGANGFLLASRQAGDVVADVSTTVVVFDDDPMTAGYESAFAERITG